jgi:hypothetical protein
MHTNLTLRQGKKFPLTMLLPVDSTTSEEGLSRKLELAAEELRIKEQIETSESSDIGGQGLSPSPIVTRSDHELTSTVSVSKRLENKGIHSMADTLLDFLESLAEPIMTYAAYSAALCIQNKAEAYKIVNSLPSVVSVCAHS